MLVRWIDADGQTQHKKLKLRNILNSIIINISIAHLVLPLKRIPVKSKQ